MPARCESTNDQIELASRAAFDRSGAPAFKPGWSWSRVEPTAHGTLIACFFGDVHHGRHVCTFFLLLPVSGSNDCRSAGSLPGCDRRPSRRRPLSLVLWKAYWYPLYAFARRCGHHPHSAEDIVQGFFATLLEKDGLTAVDRTKGRFRSFLVAACLHFLANRLDYEAQRSSADAARRSDRLIDSRPGPLRLRTRRCAYARPAVRPAWERHCCSTFWHVWSETLLLKEGIPGAAAGH